MATLTSKKRESKRSAEVLRKQGFIPSVLYGPGTENKSLAVDAKEFQSVYKDSGESTLITLDAEGETHTVLIHDTQQNHLTGEISHIDFYQPRLDEETDVMIPVVFEGEAPAVKDLGGTLVKNVHELEVRALPQNLPHELKVDVSALKTFDDHIAVGDLAKSDQYEILAEVEEIIAMVAPPEDVEAELAQPVEENIEAIEKAGEQKEQEPTEESPQESS